MIRRNSNATMRLPDTVRETASIAPPAAGVHRSSRLVAPICPAQLPASHAMSASVALAGDGSVPDDVAVCKALALFVVTSIGQIDVRTTRRAKTRLRVMSEDSTMARTRSD